jgi:nitroreductase
MRKKADSAVEMHPILAERWSPRSFDGNAELSNVDVTALLEAARWAPSANNLQPWRFVISRRGDYKFAQMIDAMTGFNKVWAPKASALILVGAVTTQADGTHRPGALYDAGLAVSLLTVEAHHRGQVVHQIGGFSHDALKAEFHLPEEITPIVILAIGKQAPADALDDPKLVDREISARSRKPLDELILSDSFQFSQADAVAS